MPHRTQLPSIDLYAHRGSTLLAPENTVLAFDLALRFGADVMETDVRISRDKRVVVIHDARLDRTCNGTGLICDHTLSQLKGLDAGYHFVDLEGNNWRHRGARLLCLEELFEYLPETRINIDIKDNHNQAAELVARCIEQTESHDRVNVGSFHGQVLEHFRRCAPSVSTAATQKEVAQLYFLRGLERQSLTKYQTLQIPVQYFGIPLSGTSFIQCAQNQGKQVVYWTINKPQTMQALIAKRVNGIVTDRVDLASAMLNKSSGKLDSIP